MCSEYAPARPLDLQELLIAVHALKDLYSDHAIGSEPPAGPGETRVFPRGQAPIVIADGEELHLVLAEFGLIPSWWHVGLNRGKSRSPRPLFATYNARLDTIAEKKSFVDAFRDLHCLVPLGAFFESSLFGAKFAGHRLRVESADGGILLAAGIYSLWVDRTTGEEILTFSIVTHDPPSAVFEAGHDRCPVLFNRSGALRWLTLRGAEASKRFCLEHNIAARTGLRISIDRALKTGWEKRAPSAGDLDAVTILEGL